MAHGLLFPVENGNKEQWKEEDAHLLHSQQSERRVEARISLPDNNKRNWTHWLSLKCLKLF